MLQKTHRPSQVGRTDSKRSKPRRRGPAETKAQVQGRGRWDKRNNDLLHTPDALHTASATGSIQCRSKKRHKPRTSTKTSTTPCESSWVFESEYCKHNGRKVRR